MPVRILEPISNVSNLSVLSLSVMQGVSRMQVSSRILSESVNTSLH